MSREAHLVSTDVIDAMDDVLATALLRNIMRRHKLNTAIAQQFIASRHAELSDALSRLDLVAGVDAVGPGYMPRTSASGSGPW
mmetsp:Transcript_6750/g.28263  ORF Transcript_6750/g.28263 Transcript_6750/m.28263 type:complete len:83 (+) Transcript_6750:442-690(+)